MTLSQHTLRSYDKQLQHLLSLILDMGREVQDLVISAKKSFRAREESLVADAKTADKHINELDLQIEEEATVVLALQNPMAIDLRYVISIIKITGMLEHAGDLAKNTVKRSVRMGDFAPEEVIVKLELMADIIVEMLGGALTAFAEKDTQKAAIIWRRDKEIDTLYREIIEMMQKEMAASAENVLPCTQVVFAAKNLERLADYTTNLAKTVYYVTAGKRPDKATLKGLAHDADASAGS
jgi:phosphate transport system protein